MNKRPVSVGFEEIVGRSTISGNTVEWDELTPLGALNSQQLQITGVQHQGVFP